MNKVKNCQYCGEEIEANLTICPICCETLSVEEDKETVLCPYCAESIDKDSAICPVCGEMLLQEPETVIIQTQEKSTNFTKIIVLCVIAIALVGGGIFGVLYKKTELLDIKDKIATTNEESIESNAKDLPEYKRANYKAEVEKHIDFAYPRVKKQYDEKLAYIKQEYKKLKNGEVIPEKDISIIDKEFDDFDSALYDLYKDLAEITNKYLDIKHYIPNTDYVDTFLNFVEPYLKQNNVNYEKVLDLGDYSSPKYEEAEKYVDLIHEITESAEYKDRKQRKKEASYSYEDTNDYGADGYYDNSPTRPAPTATAPKALQNSTNNAQIPVPKTAAPKLVGNSGRYAPSTSNTGTSKQAIKEPDFGPYMRELQRNIKNNWEPPVWYESGHIVLLFKIAKNGSLLSVTIKQSSGDQEADMAAIKAVKLAAPFKPLPPEFKGQSVDIQFAFN